MSDTVFIERRKKPWGRSASEIIVAIAAVFGLLVSLFTGTRDFYVNEYRIDQLEASVLNVKVDVSRDVREIRTDIQDLDRSVQRLVGAATQNGWVEDFNKHRRGSGER